MFNSYVKFPEVYFLFGKYCCSRIVETKFQILFGEYGVKTQPIKIKLRIPNGAFNTVFFLVLNHTQKV